MSDVKSYSTVLLGAATASAGAGLVHAAAAGTHSGTTDVVVLFAVCAAFQAIVAGCLLIAPTRTTLLAVAGVNTIAVVAWGISRTRGLPWPEAFQGVEDVGTQDLAAAALGAAAALLAGIAVANPGWAIAKPAPTAFAGAACTALLAIAIPGVAATHAHSGDAAHGHGTEAEVAAASGGAAPHDDAVPHDDTVPHDDSGDGSSIHVDGAEATAVAFDPDMPIDLGGVDGVTAEQQARAENLLAATVLLLPQWADQEYDESRGFFSIGDGGTGTEHMLNREFMEDDVILDPTRPESLVFDVDQTTGERTLSAAMYMMPPGVALEDVPDVGGPLTQWHIHDNLCFNGQGQVRGLTNPDGTCPAGLVKGAETPMIHVWIRPHECGPFAALEGVGAGSIAEGETRLCDHAHG